MRASLASVVLLGFVSPIRLLAAGLPTLSDALALRSTGQVAVSRDGRSLAIEVDGKIVIQRSSGPAQPFDVLNGGTPHWSPDSRLLAYYVADANGEKQLSIWTASTQHIDQITQFPGGISPDPFSSIMGDPLQFDWSPDSTRIVFSSRLTPNYRIEGKPSSPRVRVFSSKDPENISTLEGIFSSDYWESHGGTDPFSEYSAPRIRAIERSSEPEANSIYVIDIRTKKLHTISTGKEQYFFPAWSPNGAEIAAVVGIGKSVEWVSYPKTALSIFNLKTGKEHRTEAPMPMLRAPRWMSERRVVVLGQERMLDVATIHSLDVDTWLWTKLTSPRNLPPIDVRPTRSGRLLVVETFDRFRPSLWVISRTPNAPPRRIETGELGGGVLGFESFDSDRMGNIYIAADGPTYTGRVYLRPNDLARPLKLIYDANPQLEELQFTEQRRVTWRNSIGDDVDGIIVMPRNYSKGKRYPEIVDVYPTPATDGFNLNGTPRPHRMGQIEASMGYLVFQPGLRAPHTPGIYSRDAAYNDKARGGPGIPIMLDDFRSGVDFLVRDGLADPSAICIYGHSNGGWVANFLITADQNIKCAVISAGTSDVTFEKFFYSPADGWIDNVTASKGDIYSRLDEFIALSPIYRMNRVNVPVLLLVGDQDWFPWTPQMVMEFNTLRTLGKDATLVRYSNEQHVYHDREDIVDSLDRIHRFFGKYLISESYTMTR